MGIADNFQKFFKGVMPDNLLKSFYNNDPTRPEAEPRKGLFAFANSLIQKKQQKPFVLNAQTLERLSKTDPVTWAILRYIKSEVNSIPWDIVPDTEKIEKELDRWEEYAVDSLNPYKIEHDTFKTVLLPNNLFQETSEKLDKLMADTMLDPATKTKALRYFFKIIRKKVVFEAQSHCEEVRRIFERPNNSAETSLRALQELVIGDLLMFDAGVIIKNYSRAGKLAELYTVPGYQIKIYRNEDRTTPQPPEPAYVWEDSGIMRAEFTNSELLYIMQNPTQDGYGISPLEVAAYVITASLLAEKYNIDYFQNSNVPPGVFDLGKNITEEQRRLFQSLWDNEVQGRAGGLHKMLFMAGGENAKFIPLQNLSNRDMQMMEYMKWTVSIKCACYGISPQDIGFTEDYKGLGGGGVAQVQKDLTQSRGIGTLLQLLEQYYNAEIVRSEFEFTDVKFEFQKTSKEASPQESQIDIADIQAGVISRNERRNKIGLKPVQGGDIVAVQTAGGLFPIEQMEMQEEQAQQQGMIDPNAPTDPNADPNAEEQDLTQQGQEEEPTAPEEVAPNPFANQQQKMLKVRVNKKNKEYNKMLNETVKKLRDSGISAELRIGFESQDVNKLGSK